MAATANYVAEATRRNGSAPFFFFTVAGVGHRADADGRPPTRFSTWEPPSTYTGYQDFRGYISDDGGRPALGWSLDRVQPSDGSQDAGSFEVRIVDRSDLVAPLLAYLRSAVPVTGVAGQYGTYIAMAGGVSRTATVLTVTDPAGIALNSMVFVNNEAMRVTAKGAFTLTVTRAQWGTTAQRHYDGDEVRAAAIQPRGQIVEVYRNFQNLTSADELLRWRGALRSVQQGKDGLTWEIRADSLLRLLDVDVMRRQGRFRINGVAGNRSNLDLGLFIGISPEDEDFSTFADTVSPIYVAGSDSKGILYVNKGGVVAGATTNPPFLTANADDELVALGFADRASWLQDESVSSEHGTLWEVAPVSQQLSGIRFPNPSGGQGEHPFHLALTWMLSIVGDGTNHATYDVLPEGWGAEIPAAFVDVTSFTDLASRIPARCSNLIYGMKGDGGFNLKRHLESELLGPFGVHVVQVNGLLTLRQYGAQPAWNTGAAIAVGHDQIIEDTLPTNAIDMSDGIQGVVCKTGWSYRSKKFLERVEAYQKRREAWSLAGGRVINFELHGFPPGVRSQVKELMTAYLQRHRQPPPQLVLDIPDTHEHLIDTLDTVLITSDFLVDMTTGTRGVTSFTYILTHVAYRDLRMKVTLLNQNGALRVGSIAPAARISAVTSATVFRVVDGDVRFTVTPVFSEYADLAAWGATPGDPPVQDMDWFAAGAVGAGDLVQILDGDTLAAAGTGARRISTLVDVGAAIEITLASALTGAPAVNDYLAFAPYATADTTTRQRQFAYFSDNGKLSGSNDPVYIYAD